MQTVPDNTLLSRLRSDDNTAFGVLYEHYFPSIATYIIYNGGKTEDAEDIFQEALIVLRHKIRQPDFFLTATIKTYLFSIARNLWLKRLRDNKLMPVADISIYHWETTSFSITLHPEKSKDEKVQSWISRITGHCQRILRAIFFYREPMEVLIKKMGWKNKHTAANQQYKCIQQVKKIKQQEEDR
ncbi:sigma-70 family RNA polymerase sigma factor [Chitinophaga polysaccharea]|uniref:RNA polymerase sigma factor n=1 Tax=Chitinophaga TaxID=79328 RepID=UPI0014556CB2|nr:MULTISPECIES: sigma-70 family RNA polymerase sigma factor [Chitinophaga]NLR58208.1 sigma-70 family RNA polymerase sigma factor [Chitinophaga polysaccharea]NLU90732.1 sigma-70 family RNA polymerase sigma factor [Chitinophaga sp. Ak27]